MTDKDREGSLLSRWAKRKEALRKAEWKERASSQPEPPPPSDTSRSEAEIVAELPDIENLDETSDFTAFMREGVPAELRRQALRKLWRLNPIYNFRDGLAEYDLDYSALGKPMAEGVKTIYQVGRGMLRDEPKAGEGEQASKEESTVAADHAPAEASSADEVERPETPTEGAPSAGDGDREQALALTAEPDKAEPVLPFEPGAAKPEPQPADPPRRRAAERRWGPPKRS